MSAAFEALGGDTFVADSLSRQVVSGQIAHDVTEHGWPLVEELLSTATFEPNMFRLVGEHGRVEPDLYLETVLGGGITNRRLRPDVLLHELSGGATLTINGADRLHTTLLADREVLEYRVGQRAWCNGFISHTAGSAFGLHHDNHDVIVMQAEGTKHWRVYPADGTDRGEPVIDRVLRPGDVVHIPAGGKHEVTGTGSPSLHWTFGFVVPDVSDLTLAELTHRASLGTDLAALIGDGVRLDPDTIASAARTRSLERRTGTNLPWSFGVELPQLNRIAVRWAARLPPVTTTTDSGTTVRTLGRTYRIDARLGEALRLLTRGERVPASDLVNGDATVPVVRTFLSWAIAQRLILVEVR